MEFASGSLIKEYPKTGKVLAVLDGLPDKKLLQVGSGLSNNFEILVLKDLYEIFLNYGIKATKVLSYHEGKPNIIDIITSEIDLIILQISPNMTKDELHNIFIIYGMAQNNFVPLIINTKQLDKFMSDLDLIYYECIECNRLDSFTCTELDWETISGAERNMGLESEYQAIYKDTCNKCDNEIEITLTCWEYPIGSENTRNIEAVGAEIIQGGCCPDLHNEYGEEPTEDDEYSNLKRDAEIQQIEEEELRKVSLEASIENKKVFEIEEWLLKRYKNPNALPITLGNFELYALEDILFEHFEDENKDILNKVIVYIKEKYGDIKWELKEQFLFDKVKERSDKLEQLINLLIPYSELEYEYSWEDFSNPDEVPENEYLIDREFDGYYLSTIIDNIEEDFNELQYIIESKEFENKDFIESLLKKTYRVTYKNIPEPLGIDFDCNVYGEYTEEYNKGTSKNPSQTQTW